MGALFTGREETVMRWGGCRGSDLPGLMGKAVSEGEGGERVEPWKALCWNMAFLCGSHNLVGFKSQGESCRGPGRESKEFKRN